MNTVKVRNIEIGSGVPKICVPIVGVTKDEIIAEAKTFDSIPVDVVEWRVDWFEGVFEFDKVEDVLKDLREALGETPILFTFRTSKEGGEKAIEAEPYKELNIAAAKTGYVDLVDVEAFTGDEIVKEIVAAAHECGVKVVASNHDFDKTPEKDEIVRRLCMHRKPVVRSCDMGCGVHCRDKDNVIAAQFKFGAARRLVVAGSAGLRERARRRFRGCF